MNMDIFVILLCVLFAAAGAWVIWIEKGGNNKDDSGGSDSKG